MSVPSVVDYNVHRLKSLRAKRDKLDQEIKKLEDEIKQTMVEMDTYEFQGEDWSVTWNMVVSSRFDQSLFKASHPRLFETFKVASESRRFLLK